MKSIDVDEDVYARIMSNTTYRNESESSILRRLLGIDGHTTTALVVNHQIKTALEDHLESAEFLYAKGVVGKFLSILSFIYQQNPTAFSKAEALKGGKRLYFARDIGVLNESGRSMNPKQIPNSPYWVTTNTPTALKQEILAAVMQLLGYSTDEIQKSTLAVTV